MDGPNAERDDRGPRLVQYTPTATYDRDKKQMVGHAPHYRREIMIPDADERGPPKIRPLENPFGWKDGQNPSFNPKTGRLWRKEKEEQIEAVD